MTETVLIRPVHVAISNGQRSRLSVNARVLKSQENTTPKSNVWLYNRCWQLVATVLLRSLGRLWIWKSSGSSEVIGQVPVRKKKVSLSRSTASAGSG